MLHAFFPTSQTYWYIPGSPGHERNQVMNLSSGYSTEFHHEMFGIFIQNQTNDVLPWWLRW